MGMRSGGSCLAANKNSRHLNYSRWWVAQGGIGQEGIRKWVLTAKNSAALATLIC